MIIDTRNGGNMKKIELFDLNGPEQFAQNPMLVFDALRIERTMQLFETEGKEIGLYSLSNDPKKYMQNEEVQAALEEGEHNFPMLFVDDELKLKARYPSRSELASFTGFNENDLPEDPAVSEVAAFLSMISGSCGGSCGSCSGCGSYGSEDDEFSDEDFLDEA